MWTPFLIAHLQKTSTFCGFPDGFKKPGYCMKLNCALYVLRSSPIPWQRNFSNTLRKLGLEQIPEESCLFSNGRIIVFFYVGAWGSPVPRLTTRCLFLFFLFFQKIDSKNMNKSFPPWLYLHEKRIRRRWRKLRRNSLRNMKWEI